MKNGCSISDCILETHNPFRMIWMITNNTWRNCRHASCLYYFIRWRDFFMPKNKFQDVIFTAIMATIMVYGMIVYNCIYFRILCSRKDCKNACIYGYAPRWSSAVYYLCDFHLYLLHHVPDNEPDRNDSF